MMSSTGKSRFRRTLLTLALAALIGACGSSSDPSGGGDGTTSGTGGATTGGSTTGGTTTGGATTGGTTTGGTTTGGTTTGGNTTGGTTTGGSSTAASGTTYNVCGSDAQSQAIIAFFNAHEGDTIQFCAGEIDFTSGLVLSGKKGISVLGAGMDKTILSFKNSSA